MAIKFHPGSGFADIEVVILRVVLSTWLMSTVFTVPASGGAGRLLTKVARAASVGAKRVGFPLRAPTRSACSMRAVRVLSPWLIRPSWRVLLPP